MTIYRPIIARDILSIVLHHYNITIEDMHSDRRTSKHYDITSAREAFAWLCRKYTKTSYPDIAEVGGCRSHSSVIAQHRRAIAKHAADPGIYAEMEQKVLNGRIAA